jgi:hypothetical protein
MCDVCFCSNHCTSITTLYWNKTHNGYHSTWSAHMYTLFFGTHPLPPPTSSPKHYTLSDAVQLLKKVPSNLMLWGINTLNRSHESITVP